MARKKTLGKYLSAFFSRFKWYELLTITVGVLILMSACLAWWFGDRTLKWGVDVAEPTCLAFGALSIILLWAQLRVASNQAKQEGIWKRIEYMHEHFHDVPRLDITEAVRTYLYCELNVHTPPSVCQPLTRIEAERIQNDTGNNGRPPARELIARYLNDWEDFCGAINVGVIDDDYAAKIEGKRLIDAFFGYREAINVFREVRDREEKVSASATGAPPFATILWYELQRVALRWHGKRTAELGVLEERLAAANREADRLRDEAQALTGVQPMAKDELEVGPRRRY